MAAAALPIPLVELRPGTGNGPALHPAIVAGVRAAAEDAGFFVVTGHGVREPVIERICRLSRAFFDMPDAVKRQVRETGSVSGGMMYFPL